MPDRAARSGAGGRPPRARGKDDGTSGSTAAHSSSWTGVGVMRALLRQAVRILRRDDRPPAAGSASNFTGTVRVASRFQAEAPARVGGGGVTFEPGAHGLARAPAGPDAARHRRLRLGAAGGRPSAGDPAG